MLEEMRLGAPEDPTGGKRFPAATAAALPAAARGGGGRHNSSSQQQQRETVAVPPSSGFAGGSLLQEMRALQEKLETDIHHLETKIHEMETDYLSAPAEVGNMIKGWEGYVSTGTKARRLPQKTGNSASGASERLFSLTSCTSQASKELGRWTTAAAALLRLYLAGPPECGDAVSGDYSAEDDVLQPAPAPVTTSTWGKNNNNNSTSSAVSQTSSSSQRHGKGGGGSVVRVGKRSHTKQSSHGGGSSRRSGTKGHGASAEVKAESRGDYGEEHCRVDRSSGSVASDRRCV